MSGELNGLNTGPVNKDFRRELLAMVGFEEAEIDDLDRRGMLGVQVTAELGFLNVSVRVQASTALERLEGVTLRMEFRRTVNTRKWCCWQTGKLIPIPNGVIGNLVGKIPPG